MIIQIGELYLNLAPSVLAAIGAGVGLVLIILIICCCWCCCRRKDRKDKEGGQKIHVENAPQVKGNQNGAQQWQHQSNPPRVAAAVAASPSLQPPNVALTPLHRQSSMSSTSGSPLPPHSAKKSPSPQPQSPFNMSQSIGDSITSNGSSIPPHSPVPSFASSQTMFSYEELVMATNGFSKGNILGQGGFGFVHKGVLPTGKEIAVKSLKADSGQGEREFQAEVEIISRVHHRHLVSLVGYCITGSHRLLVYELVPNKTLEFHLHGAEPALDWPTRMKIAIGAAKGLAYLHEDCHPRIIHRDIKAANILIDNNFEAKVADFGLAKLHSLTETHITTRVMGTLGYLAPEYASSGKLTDKSDVYSFGVMLLELITGRLPVDRTREKTINLVEWARPLLTAAVEDENFNALVDPRIQYCYKHTEMSRMVYCAATCARKSSRRRPQMSQIVRALEGNISLSDLTAGISPGRSMMNRYDSSSGYSSSQYTGASKGYGSSAEYSPRQYKGDSRGYESTGISTGERYITTGEHDGTTSEYGLYASSSSSEDQTTRELDTEEVKREIRRPQRRYF